jgi:hypothetical protein
MEQIYNKYKKQIKWALLALFACLFLVWIFTKKPTISDESRQTIDSLENVIKLKNDSFNQVQVKIDSLGIEYILLENEKQSNKDKITYINNYYNEKIDAIDSYTNDSLQQFFTNRYK